MQVNPLEAWRCIKIPNTPGERVRDPVDELPIEYGEALDTASLVSLEAFGCGSAASQFRKTPLV